MATLEARRDYDGKLTLLPDAPDCGGHEAEPTYYLVRAYRLRSSGETVKVRVGFHCSCGAVYVDGYYEGSSPQTH